MNARALRIRTPSDLGIRSRVAVGGRQARETEGFGVRGGEWTKFQGRRPQGLRAIVGCETIEVLPMHRGRLTSLGVWKRKSCESQHNVPVQRKR